MENDSRKTTGKTGAAPGRRLKGSLLWCGRALKKPQIAFLVIGFVFGMFMLVSNPPFHAMDEQVHFFKAYCVSEGHIFPDKVGTDVGSNVPESFHKLLEIVKFWPPPNRKLTASGDIFPAFKQQLDSGKKKFYSFGVTYPPLPYVAQAIGIDIGRLFCLPPIMLLYLARFFNLLLWLFLVYLAIRLAPVHKWVFFLLGIAPIAINLAASASGDTFLTGISFVAIAFFFKLALDEGKTSIETKDLVFLFIVMFLVSLAKPTYFLLALLFFMIPMAKFKSKKQYFVIFALLLVFSIIVSGGWSLMVKGAFRDRGPTISAGRQLTWMLEHPLGFTRMLLHSLNGYKEVWMRAFIGGLGWFEVSLPWSFIFMYYFALISVSGLDKNEIIVNWKQKLWALLVFCLGAFAVIVSLYMVWTPVGGRIIEGVQPRYFLPYVPLILLLFYNQKIKYEKGTGWYVALETFGLFTLAITMFKIITTYYK